ncbi:MAG TPA: MlaD family protein [Allosphingosinicella sp.]|nr:MlaD family protein [Allosphingosinicella sp.]
METRSNKILVSLVVALVLAAIVATSLWMTAARRSSGRPYEILITKSVSGLLVGSPVTFSGVPVGRVTSVRLDPTQPGAVRVRIDITDDDLPIAEGTVARLNSDLLFGTALVSLERESRSGRPLLARAGHEVPLIPLGSGGMGDVISDPTPMVESIAYATDRLLEATTPEQQRLLTARIEEMERTTAEIAAQGSALDARIAPARQSVREGTASAADAARQARLMRQNLDQRSRTAAGELKATLRAAREATAALDQQLKTASPSVRNFSASVEGSGQSIKKAREGAAALKEQVQKVESSGAGTLISGPPTPDYQPKKSR